MVEALEPGHADFCEKALAGETVQFEFPNGAILQLAAINLPLAVPALSQGQLASCYQDEDWAVFENNCGKASD